MRSVNTVPVRRVQLEASQCDSVVSCVCINHARECSTTVQALISILVSSFPLIYVTRKYYLTTLDLIDLTVMSGAPRREASQKRVKSMAQNYCFDILKIHDE